MTLLKVSRVTKHHADGRRTLAVLDNVSLEIEAGDFVGMWGPRRSGKSTLLRILAGIERPQSGEIEFDGVKLGELSARRRARLLRRGGIALVKPVGGLSSNHTAVRDVALGLLADGLSMRQAELQARRGLGEVGAGECADLKLDLLTLNERIRVALAGALVREPRLLLVDEPAVLSSLRETDALYRFLRSLGGRGDVALLIASEELDPLHGARRICSLSDGELRSMESAGVVLPFRERRQSWSSRAS
ncbi:MAG TPA: ATP-binding cassette domain-containing protein [Solirubrobacteraceae bacterium]|jgi:lipoprotein-releasing system ATP-binding protein|nr:ATP-binding cassette domain-containing protein [Solirubrobacteraceae bacterium]